jgi:hypothetical protein
MMDIIVTFGKQAVTYQVPAYETTREYRAYADWQMAKLSGDKVREIQAKAYYDSYSLTPPLNSQSDK